MEPTSVAAAGYLSDGCAGPDKGGKGSTAQSGGGGRLLCWCLVVAGALLAACELDGCCMALAAYRCGLEELWCRRSCIPHHRIITVNNGTVDAAAAMDMAVGSVLRKP
eukprot:897259-Amphidinium_carterae.1